jgi:SAM-dependent methyltransferase
MPLAFALYDIRHYQTVSVTEGYREWAPTYDSTADNRVDFSLCEALETVSWRRVTKLLDLACGTGRVGVWARAHGVSLVDGLDFSSFMLKRAAAKGVYERLIQADLMSENCPIPNCAYDVVVCSLTVCHLANLVPLYALAARALHQQGLFVVVDYHPYMLLGGVPTHFERASGEPVAITNVVHLFEDHVRAAHRAGLQLVELRERLVDEEWVAERPAMARYQNRPISFAGVWQRPLPDGSLKIVASGEKEYFG